MAPKLRAQVVSLVYLTAAQVVKAYLLDKSDLRTQAKEDRDLRLLEVVVLDRGEVKMVRVPNCLNHSSCESSRMILVIYNRNDTTSFCYEEINCDENGTICRNFRYNGNGYTIYHTTQRLCTRFTRRKKQWLVMS
jgi:hypothetical protein